jgi:hypothetical protein
MAAVAITTLGVGSAQAVASPSPLLSTELGAGCAPVVDSPSVGLTTITDTTLPKVTSVAWAHTSVIAKAKATAHVTVRLSDDCAGAGDVFLELHNASTGANFYYGEAASWVETPTATGISDTVAFNVPLYGTDAGSLSVSKVDVISGFQTLTYTSGAAPTEADITDLTPDPSTVTADDYTRVTPPTVARIVVKAYTTLTVNATPEPASINHSVTVKASLKKLHTSTYIADAYQYVTLQYRLPGSSTWHSIKKVKTNSSGVASTTFKVTRKGTYGFRAVYAGATYAAAVNSSTDGVLVH